MAIKAEDLGALLGRTVRFRKSSSDGKGHVYYEGVLEQNYLFKNMYTIYSPTVRQDRVKKKTTGSWVHIRIRDYEDGELAVVDRQA